MNSGKKRILIVEDDEEMSALLRDVIEEDGYQTASANNGSEAFRQLVEESFDLIITDIRMPGLTGLDILPELKRLQPNIPILVITTFGGEEICQKALLRGADAFLEKPVHLLKLRTLIHNLIDSENQ